MHKIKILKNLGGISVCKRYFATQQRLTISKHEDDIYAIEMQNGPVNALNLEFMRDLVHAIKSLENNADCKAIIFSSFRKAFSAGFFLNEMLDPDTKRLKEFWKSAQNLALTIMKTPLITASAINGSCIAGGCVFSFLSDITVMNRSDDLRIGLSATKMGILPPEMLLMPLINLVGHRKAEMYASQSILLNPADAKESGMVQYIADGKDVLPLTVNLIKEYIAIPQDGRIASKKLFTKRILDELDTKESLNNEVETFSKSLLSPEVQSMIRSHLEGISRKN